MTKPTQSTPLIIQPLDNEYAADVFRELVTLAASFRARQYFSVVDELEGIALRGPEPWRGLKHLSDHDVLKLAGDRLHCIAKNASTAAN